MVRDLSSVLICNTEVFNYKAWTKQVTWVFCQTRPVMNPDAGNLYE